MVQRKMFTKLNEQTRPGSYLARSHPSDVARVEERLRVGNVERDRPGHPVASLVDRGEAGRRGRAGEVGVRIRAGRERDRRSIQEGQGIRARSQLDSFGCAE